MTRLAPTCAPARWHAKFSGGPYDGQVKCLRGMNPPDLIHAIPIRTGLHSTPAVKPWWPARAAAEPGADDLGTYWRVGQIPGIRIAGYMWLPPEDHR